VTSRRSPVAAGLAAALLLVLTAVAPVYAHAELVSSDPKDGAVLATPPTTITLTFSEGVVGKSSINLLAADGSTVATGGPAKDGDEIMALSNLALAAGAYTVQWTSVADDGDILRGTLAFTVEAASPEPSSAAPSASPTPTAPASASPTPAPSPSSAPAPTAAAGGDTLIPIIAALVLVGVVGYLVLRRNRAA
jgi:methionine-rich copper-binding protein CopC